jgi:hypothetical protein
MVCPSRRRFTARQASVWDGKQIDNELQFQVAIVAVHRRADCINLTPMFDRRASDPCARIAIFCSAVGTVSARSSECSFTDSIAVQPISPRMGNANKSNRGEVKAILKSVQR